MWKSGSPKIYRCIRKIWKVSLPTVSTLNRNQLNINCEPGLLNSVSKLMKASSYSMKMKDNYVAFHLVDVHRVCTSVVTEFTHKSKDQV